MIVDLLISGALEVVSGLLGFIPDGANPFGAATEEYAELVGSAVGGLDGLLPITELLVAVGWVLTTYVPVVVTYSVARWVYTHLPVIGNGG